MPKQETKRCQRAARQRGDRCETDFCAVDLRPTHELCRLGHEGSIDPGAEHEPAVIAKVGRHHRGPQVIDGCQWTGGELDAEKPISSELSSLLQCPVDLIRWGVLERGND